MTREEFLRQKIKQSGTSEKKFAENIGMAYSTLRSILASVGGASVDNIIKICGGLEMEVKELQGIEKEKPLTGSDGEGLSQDEISLIDLYRLVPADRRKELMNLIVSALKMQGLL